MAFDGLVLAAVRQELVQKLVGGRINKIYQPEKEEIVLHIRSLGENEKLVVSAHAQRARVHLTSTQKENPQSPPMFCMILRKYLEGGKITRVEQPGLERVLQIYIEGYDELGCLGEKILLVEIMGKHSNIILLEPNTNTILDGIKRYSHATSRHREVLPGREYTPPPSQEKIHPADLTLDLLQDLLLAAPVESRVAKILLQHLDGFSPESCREVLVHSNLAEELLVDGCGQYEFQRMWQTIAQIKEMLDSGNLVPTLVRDSQGLAQAFSALDLKQYHPLPKEHDTMNNLLERYYSERQHLESFGQQKNHLAQVVATELARMEKKLAQQDDVLVEAIAAETYKLYGELLTVNMHLLSKGMSSIMVTNYYDPESPAMEIPLDLQFTPSQQVQYYYKKYTKARNGAKIAGEHREKVLEEIRYLESVGSSIDQATTRGELLEIKIELGEGGYIKGGSKGTKTTTGGKPKGNKAVSPEIPVPMEFLVSGDRTVLVGKNNRQNDYLTLKIARADDLWLHVKDLPGSHVIIRSQGQGEVPEAALWEAAQLAAYFSQARYSGKVPVDYTLKKHVRKPRGAKPGRVIYDQQKTIYVTPEETTIMKLKNK
ncbi:MAG: NFACT RNA binding domain-containing protein [Carboxydocellales bacterium]